MRHWLSRGLLFEWIRSRRRMTALAIGLSAVLVYEAARAWYRPFVYSRGIFDFHIADTLGNSLGTIATVMVFASLFGRTPAQGLFVLRASAMAVVVYELAHPLLGKPVDPADILATVLAALLCDFVYRGLTRLDRPAPMSALAPPAPR